jgi:hypothetical protein
MKVVSKFEYAIMQAAHESDPKSVTKEDLDNVRPITDEEDMERRAASIRSQMEKLKVKK